MKRRLIAPTTQCSARKIRGSEMAQRDVKAHVIGRRYDCDHCGEEMVRHGNTVLTSFPEQHPHICPNGHTANLTRSYPSYDVLITQEDA